MQHLMEISIIHDDKVIHLDSEKDIQIVQKIMKRFSKNFLTHSISYLILLNLYSNLEFK